MICDKCHYCTHGPDAERPYWWCSRYGVEIKQEKDTCPLHRKIRGRRR